MCSNVSGHAAGDSVRDHKVSENHSIFFSSQVPNTIHMGLLEAGWQMEPEPLFRAKLRFRHL